MHLRCQVFQHGGEIHRSASPDPLRVLPRLQEASNSAHWELQASLGTAGHRLLSRSLAIVL